MAFTDEEKATVLNQLTEVTEEVTKDRYNQLLIIGIDSESVAIKGSMSNQGVMDSINCLAKYLLKN